MKRIVVLSCVMLLQGLCVFGETNSVPAKIQNAAAQPQPQTGNTNNPALPSNIDLSNNAQTQQPAQTAAMKRRAREKVLAAQRSKPDYNAQMNAIFHPGDDQTGNTVIHDTIITIYPSR